MAKFRGAVVVDKEKCKGCNLCVVACPTKTLDLAKEVNGPGYHYSVRVTPDAWIGCAGGALVCPVAVITVYKMNVQ